jgi:hypothetical protein
MGKLTGLASYTMDYYHMLWVSKGQRVSKCSFLRDHSIPLPDLVLNLTKVTYMDNFAQIM